MRKPAKNSVLAGEVEGVIERLGTIMGRFSVRLHQQVTLIGAYPSRVSGCIWGDTIRSLPNLI